MKKLKYAAVFLLPLNTPIVFAQGLPINPFNAPDLQKLVTQAQPQAEVADPAATPVAPPESLKVGPQANAPLVNLDGAKRYSVLYVMESEALLAFDTQEAGDRPKTIFIRHNEPVYVNGQWLLPDIERDTVMLYATDAPSGARPVRTKAKRPVRHEAIWSGRVESVDKSNSQNVTDATIVGPNLYSPSTKGIGR